SAHENEQGYTPEELGADGEQPAAGHGSERQRSSSEFLTSDTLTREQATARQIASSRARDVIRTHPAASRPVIDDAGNIIGYFVPASALEDAPSDYAEETNAEIEWEEALDADEDAGSARQLRATRDSLGIPIMPDSAPTHLLGTAHRPMDEDSGPWGP